MSDIIIKDPNAVTVGIARPNGVKVNIGASTKIRSVPLQETTRSIVAPGERKPTITPDSVVLGIDTIGEYIRLLNVGDGLVLSGNNAIESANLVISHANTSFEVSTNNDLFGVISNVAIDNFGHITNFESKQFNPEYFSANTTVISTKDFTLGDTTLNLGQSTQNIEGLVHLDSDLITANNVIVSSSIISSNDNMIITSNTVTVNGSGAFILPNGTSAERPVPVAGMLRFNTELNRYESYIDDDWTTLGGGVIDSNQDTFIRAENPNGANNDELEFYTNGVRRGVIGANGDVSLGQSSSALYLYYNTGEVNVNGFLTVNEIKIENDQISANNSLQLTAAQNVDITSEDINLSANAAFNIDSNQITISSEESLTFNANDDIIFNVANGSVISAGGAKISDVGNPDSPQDVVTLDYLENDFTFEIDVEYGANTKPLFLSTSTNPKIFAGTGIDADVANNTLSIAINDTGVTPEFYGTDGFIPRIRVGSDGRISFATEVPIEIVAGAIPNFTETVHDLVGEMFRNNIEEGIHVFEDDNTDTINLRVDNFSVDITGDVAGSATVISASNTIIDTVITVDYLAGISAGSGIDISFTPGIGAVPVISHANTSDVTDTTNTSGNVVRNLTFDEFGHVIGTESEDLNDKFLNLGGGVLTGDISAPRFVDADNSDYYVDPNSTSRLRGLTLGFGQSNARLEMRDGPNSSSVLLSQSGLIGFLANDFNFGAYYDKINNNWFVRNDAIAERFVDASDSQYFVNPAGTDTLLSGLNVKNTIQIDGDLSINSSTISASGLTLSSDNDIISVNGSRIADVLIPINNNDAANKIYVDTVIGDAVVNFVGGEGLAYNANTFTFGVNVDGTSIEIINDTLSIVDGAGSGLDSDLLDGQQGAFYLDYNNFTNTPADYVLDANTIVDIIASTSIDADLLDGQDSSFFLDFNNFVNVPPAPELDANSVVDIIASTSIDADLLDGQDSTFFLDFNNLINVPASQTITANNILDLLVTADGTGSGLDADLLDGNDSPFYLDYSNFTNTPTILDATDVINISTGLIANTSIDADLLDGQDSSFFLDFNNLINVPSVQSNDFDLVLDGKVTGSASSSNGSITVITELANTAVTSGVYGSSSQVPVLTIDEDGRISNAETISVAGVSNTIWNSANNTYTIETADGSSFNSRIDSFGVNTTFADLSVTGLINGRDLTADGSKLDNIEDNATRDQTDQEIIDAVKSLDGVGSGLDADLLDGQQGAFYLDYNNFTNAPFVLDANNVTDIINATEIDAELFDGLNSPYFLNYDNFTNTPTIPDVLDGNDILNLLSTVDGSGSGLDSDLLDGQESNYFLDFNNLINVPDFTANTVTATPAQTLEALIQVDGANSGLDSDLLDGQQGAFYLDYSNFVNTPTIPDVLDGNDVLNLLSTVDGTGSGLDADLLDGLNSQYFTNYTDDAVDGISAGISNSTITIVTGDGITGGGSFTLNQLANTSITVEHANTSDVSDVSTADKSIISSISFDQFGHTLETTTRTLDFFTTTEANDTFVNASGDVMTGDLEVQGDILQNESKFGSDLVSFGTVLDVDLWSFAAVDYSSADIIITAQQGINKHITKLLIIHDGTDAYATEFGTVYTNESLADYDVRLDAGNVIISATPSNGITINYKIISTLISN